MKKPSFASRVRAALIKLSPNGEPVGAEALSLELDIIDNRGRHRIHQTLADMRKTGEVERLAPGLVAYRGKGAQPDRRDAMWSVLRMRKSVTADDLQELAGVQRQYAREFMAMLVRRGCVERIRRPDSTCIYRLIEDIGRTTPQDTAKIDRLRAIREAKKRALGDLDAAGKNLIEAAQAIARARIAVNDIPEEDDHAD